MSMLENIPHFRDVKTQQDAYELLSTLINKFSFTQMKDKMIELFQFENEIKIIPELENIEGSMEQYNIENVNELKL